MNKELLEKLKDVKDTIEQSIEATTWGQAEYYSDIAYRKMEEILMEDRFGKYNK